MSGKSTKRPINPFDRGWKRNFAQILGPSFLALILPDSSLSLELRSLLREK